MFPLVLEAFVLLSDDEASNDHQALRMLAKAFLAVGDEFKALSAWSPIAPPQRYGMNKEKKWDPVFGDVGYSCDGGCNNEPWTLTTRMQNR